MSTEEITFESADGLTLEGAVDAPTEPRAALVLCHPHPKMGGTMNAPLLAALRDHLISEGWAVVRFNFRGIGASQGTSSTGMEEISDAEGAIAYTRARFEALPSAIAGWSFGAAVAVRAAARDDSLAGCVAIAPAVIATPGVTDGLPAPNEIEIDVPLLVACGANDEVVDPEDCRRWAEAAFAEHIVLKGANHFFWGHYEQLAVKIARWLDEVI